MLTETQKDVKIAYLEQENNRLRGALLDYQVVASDTDFERRDGRGNAWFIYLCTRPMVLLRD